jgi:hypothetical protein
MMYEQDPWSWVNQQKPVAPLGASIQPSQEQAPGVLYTQPDPLEQQLQSMAVGKGVDAAATGLSAGYKAAMAPAVVAPLSAGSVLGTSAPAMSLAPAATTAATEGLIASGIPGLAAPLASTTATGAALAGTGTAATGGALASTGAAAGTGAAMVGGEAALAALGPVGWAIGAGLLAKKLGIF